MNKVILTCCGQEFASWFEDGITCPACSTPFTESELDHIEWEEQTKVPVVDTLRATQMLQIPQEEVLKHSAALQAWEEPLMGLVYPITAIRHFANEKSLKIVPRPISNGVLWAGKNRASS